LPKSAWQEKARGLLNPAVSLLARSGATPTGVTLAGLALNVAAGVVIAMGHAAMGGGVLILAGVCDALDGQLARRTGRVSPFGAFLDSSIDRIDEAAVLCGIAGWYLQSGREYAGAFVLLTFAALAGSIITSYTRARAEGLGIDCKVGAFERPERVVVTIAGLLFGATALAGAVILITVFSWITVLQRIVHVRGAVRRAAAPPVPPRPAVSGASPAFPAGSPPDLEPGSRQTR